MVYTHTETTNLDCFLLDAVLDVDRRGDEVERESFLRSAGDGDLDSCVFCTSGDGETEELLWRLHVILTGEEESSSSSEPSEQSDPSRLGSGEPDLDLEISCSLDELVCSLCSLLWLGARCSCDLSEELPAWGLEAAAEGTGFQPPVCCTC